MNESYEIIKQLAGELHDMQAKYEQASKDREQYQRWWLEERSIREKAEEEAKSLQDYIEGFTAREEA